ncbi:MAG: hypothetical protein H0U27_09650 [Nitrosopumilus sp.]|nr:hypothetical protein [Nitrosopumilus sp.]
MVKSLLTTIFCLAIAFGSFAGNSDLFQIDEQKVNIQFNELNQVESYVIENNATLNDIEATNSDLLNNINLDRNTANGILGPENTMDGPVGIPSFLWGCVLGPIGVLVVWLETEDNDELKKSFYGCLAFGVFWFVLPFLASLIWSGFFYF